MERNDEEDESGIHIPIDAAPDAVVVVDDHGQIHAVNELAQQMFGYAREELLGRSIEVLVPVRYRKRHESQRDAYIAHPKTRPMGTGQELLGRRKDGSEFPVEISLSPLGAPESPLVVSIVRDTTAQKAAEAKFRGLLESAPDAIVVVDRSGTIQIVNTRTEELFGYSREELVNQKVELLVPEELRGRHAHDRDAYTRNARTRPMGAGLPLQARRKNGTTFPVEISLSPLVTAGETLITSIIRDISDRIRADEERRALLAAQIRADEISRAKDAFLMTLSHELRTPLTSILGWASVLMLDRGRMPGKLAEALDAIRNSAVAQARIIDDVLEVSRMMTGKIELQMRLVDPTELLYAAIQTVRPTADAKRVRIVTEIGPDIGVLPADAARLQQVIWNLLVNAIKYSLKGGRIDVRMARDASRLELEVSDHGEGIDRAFLPHVFEPFLQADSSTTRSHGGLGLGLSIVRQIVELHGGNATARSEGPGQGSTFRIELPIVAGVSEDAGAGPVAAEASIPGETPAIEGVRVLYVDDDAPSRAVVAAMLHRLGAEVTIAASGDEALARVDSIRPDIVLTDVAMPAMDGYELLDLLRSRVPNLPIIALTALTRAEDERKAAGASFDVVVRKPTDPGTLAAAVHAVLEKRRGS